MDNKSNEFKELQSKWYAKLKKMGFDDIEQDDDNLKIWEAYHLKIRYDDATAEGIRSYFQLAGSFLHDHKFQKNVHKTIWEKHSEGLTVREIVKYLVKVKAKGRVKSTVVHDIISKYRKIMLGNK